MFHTYETPIELGGTSPCSSDPLDAIEEIADLQYAGQICATELPLTGKGSKEETYLHNVANVCASLMLQKLILYEPATRADITRRSDELW